MSAELDDQVTLWLQALTSGDEQAVQRVFDAYFPRLTALARRRLAEGARRTADEEDVALSAFHDFCQGAAGGRFGGLQDRHDLWRLLASITRRKAAHYVRDGLRQKRGGGGVRGESVFAGTDDAPLAGIGGVAGEGETPDEAVQAAEACACLLAALPDEELRQAAVLKLEGYSNEEIAERLGVAPRTVERRLHKIRECWSGGV